MRTHRPLTFGLLGLVVFLLVYTAPVGAAVGHKLLFTFGSFTRPMNVTVHQTSENVYVTDSGANVVDVFSAGGGAPSGILTPLTGPAELPFSFGGEPSAVAIDESAEPDDLSRGDLYVSDAAHSVVDKFKLNVSGEYEYVCRFTGYGRGCVEKPTESPSWQEPDGVAVDSTGNVYIASFGPGHGAIFEFNPEGANVREFSGGDIGARNGPVGVAVDSVGNIYVNNYIQSIVKIDPGGNETFLDINHPRAVAVDAHGDVFVDESSNGEPVGRNPRIVEYNQAGEEIDNFGEGIIAASEGVAVNSSTGNVYVANRIGNDIEVFAQVLVPSARTEGHSAVKGTTAEVSGAVNPEGIEAHYVYEYGPCVAPTPCSESPYSERTPEESLENPTASEFESANASLAGLTPERTYHYRVVGVNSNGDKQGKEEVFTTGPTVTGVSTGVATDVQPLSAVLNGQLEPEGAETLFYFEYATDKEYIENQTYTRASGFVTSSAVAQVHASAAIAELEPGTTYHFRLFVLSPSLELRTTLGQDRTFTTPPALPTVNDQPPFATNVAAHEATLHGMIAPGRGVTRYHFIYGSTSAYGASTKEAYTQFNADDRAVAPNENEIARYPVEQLLTGLSAGTAVHYALVATNATGTVVGPDEEFTTLTSPSPLEETDGPSGPPLEVVPIDGIVQPSTPALLPIPSFPAIGPLKTPPPAKCRKGFVRKKAGKCARKKRPRVAKRRKH